MNSLWSRWRGQPKVKSRLSRRRRALQFEHLDARRVLATLSLTNTTVAENAAGAIIGDVLVDGAPISSNSVTVEYTAQIVTVSNTPFGYTSAEARLQMVSGSFTYDLATSDLTPNDPARGNYKHVVAGAFQANIAALGLTITGSGLAHVQIENFSPGVSDTFRFIDGPRAVGPSGGIMSANGAPSSSIELGIAFTDSSGNAFTTDALPNPLPFAVAPLNAPNPLWFPHTFSLKDFGGTMLLQLTSIQMANSYSFTVSDNRFEMVGNQLKLKAGVSLNYEAAASIPLQITANGSGDSSTESFVINVTNVNEAPGNIKLSRTGVFANIAGAWVGAVSFSDVDSTSGHTVTVSDSRFTVSQGHLYLKPSAMLQRAVDPTVNLIVHVTDPQGATGSQAFTLAVNTPPTTWQYAHQWAPNPYDVDADGVVAPLDALLIINAINSRGVRGLTPATGGTLPPNFLDVKGDNLLDPLDAVSVINYMNARGIAQSEADDESELTPDGEAALATDEAFTAAASSDESLAWLLWHWQADLDGKARIASREE